MDQLTAPASQTAALPPREDICNIVLQVLYANQGRARTAQACAEVAEVLGLTPEQLERKTKRGDESHHKKEIQFAHALLKKQKALIEGKRGWWELSAAGWERAGHLPPIGDARKSLLINADFDELGFFAEGKPIFAQHTRYERSKALIKAKKVAWLKKHDTLYCEVCRFDFSEHYGELGDGYIECHHTRPIAEIHKSEETWGTHLDGVVLLCANCHRMAHAHPELLSLSQLVDVWRRQHPNTGK